MEFTSFICSIVLHLIDISNGFDTGIDRHFARDSATFSRFLLYKNSMNRGRYSSLDVSMDTITTSASGLCKKFFHIRPRFSRVAEEPEWFLSNNAHSGAAVFEKFLRFREV